MTGKVRAPAWQALDAIRDKMLDAAKARIEWKEEREKDPDRFRRVLLEVLLRKLMYRSAEDARSIPQTDRLYRNSIVRLVDEIEKGVRETQCSPEEGDEVLAQLLADVARSIANSFIGTSQGKRKEQARRRFGVDRMTEEVTYSA